MMGFSNLKLVSIDPRAFRCLLLVGQHDKHPPIPSNENLIASISDQVPKHVFSVPLEELRSCHFRTNAVVILQVPESVRDQLRMVAPIQNELLSAQL